MNFKTNLDIFIKLKNISQKEISEVLGISQQLFSRKKNSGIWNLKEVYLLASHFKCSIEEIFGEV